MLFFSPLEQFAIIKIVPITLGSVDLSITNSTILTVLSFTLAFVFLSFACSNAKLVPSS
jgi:F-type H+-transporting ATPase subunit a